MATLPLAAWSPAGPGPAQRKPHSVQPTLPAPAIRTQPGFSDLEFSVIDLARRDRLSSLREPNRFWTIVYAVFGLKPANRLANDKLEALRRIAVLAWHHRWNVSHYDLNAFFAAGYTPDHYEQLQARIAKARAVSSRRAAK